ncbi:MAG: RHS repeat-associated core domain-containing protein [Candidatus Hydrogenedentes bacterium]|nr:RHS repeat-associated core domain-containing protein [Candidatus Hydrogenedentota bacterium]
MRHAFAPPHALAAPAVESSFSSNSKTFLGGFYVPRGVVGDQNPHRKTTLQKGLIRSLSLNIHDYTYDDGDNVLTKVEPFFDDFNDGNTTGWTVSGTWSASNNMLESTGTGAPFLSKSNTDADNEVSLRYRINNTSNSQTRAYIYPRFTDWNNHIWVRIFPGSIDIYKIVGGTPTQLASASTTSTQDTWYNLRIVSDGNNVDVYRWADGAMPTNVVSTTGANYTSTSEFKINVQTGFLYDFDDIRVLADGLSNTTTFAVNNANELTSMTDFNGTTSFGYDDWGRMTSKSRGSHSAAYGYRYGQMLHSVTSNWPGEDNATYQFGSDEKRRARTVGGNTTIYNWDSAWNIISEENATGGLTSPYILRRNTLSSHLLANISGSNPTSGVAAYSFHDTLSSPRSTRDASKNSIGEYEYDPYGSMFSQSGTTPDFGLARYSWDGTSAMYYTAFRNYIPTLGRWASRDQLFPLTGPNSYVYVNGSPINHTDVLGLFENYGCLDWQLGNDTQPNQNVIASLRCISSHIGMCLTVSGGTSPETGSQHGENSEHNTGNAADVHPPVGATGDTFWCAASDCGFTFGLDEDDHYHVDFGPDRGKPTNPDGTVTNQIQTANCDPDCPAYPAN